MRDNDDIPLTEREAAALLKVNPETLARLRRDGRAPKHFKIGPQFRYMRSAVLEWCAAQARAVQEG